MNRLILSTALLLLLTACATVPPSIDRGPFSSVPLKQAQTGETTGTRVRWGGMIISVAPSKSGTCFEVLSRPLDSSGEPQRTDQTEGRFMACSKDFYDPAAYPAGRSITFVGTLQAPAECKIGEYAQPCPRLEIESFHLWPKLEPYNYYYPYYDPFWGSRPYRYPYWMY